MSIKYLSHSQGFPTGIATKKRGEDTLTKKMFRLMEDHQPEHYIDLQEFPALFDIRIEITYHRHNEVTPEHSTQRMFYSVRRS